MSLAARKLLPYALTILAGLGLYKVLFLFLIPALPVVAMKIHGTPVRCTWKRILTSALDSQRFAKIQAEIQPTLQAEQRDLQLGAQAIRSPRRLFWSQQASPDTAGVAYLLAEQRWFAEMSPDNQVRAGDVAIDCGANIGSFVDFALERGASKVVAVEPQPGNIECLRRTFAAEINSGRMVLVTKGVWNEAKTIKFMLGQNNATGSMVRQDGDGGTIEVQVDTLDNIVRELGLERVDFIKMDIEGAERQALQGAQDTLRKHRPRLMIDSYHLPDDMEVLPKIIRAGRPDYTLTCGPCSANPNTENAMLVPHVTYYK